METLLLNHIRSAESFNAIRNVYVEPSDMLVTSLATAILTISLLGRAQVYADIRPQSKVNSLRLAQVIGTTELTIEPLPFEEAIDFFRDKVSLLPAEFAVLSDAAKYKAFSIAAGATEQIVSSIRELVDQAQTEGMELREFQTLAADVLDRAGAASRAPWYWETVYRTNLQTSYHVGRWKQMVDPDVVAARPYWRYVSARIPTSRPSHVEKHGLIYPAHHPFWKTWYPPSGFNCLPGEAVINTARGDIPIAQVKHGDLVMTHRGRWRAVTELHRNLFVDDLMRITIGDGRVLRLTPNHKIFTQRGWVEAACLNTMDQIGDLTPRLFNTENDVLYGVRHNCVIQQHQSLINIVKIEQEPFSGTVYNLGVAEDHSYCVEGLALHNCLCTVTTVSESLLSRRGWTVSDDMQFKYPEPDEGWAVNPGEMETI